MIYIAVRCQRRVGSVGRSARSLVTGLVRRHIGARSYRVHRRIGIRLVSLYELSCHGLAELARTEFTRAKLALAELARTELARVELV